MSHGQLIIAIIKFLKEESVNESLSPGSRESLEVAVQCLRAAYDLNSDDELENSLLNLDTCLSEIFQKAMEVLEEKSGTETSEIKKKAESLKLMGNDHMKAGKFQEAVKSYTEALALDGGNAIYYCNRAAAYAKLNNFKSALNDCKKALFIDPKYAKAHGRMGLAYSSLKQHEEALECFKKALELEPNNDSYQLYLKMEEDAIKSKNNSSGASGPSSASSVLPNLDWQAIFSNPAFRNMATSLMQDPNIINMFTGGNPPTPSNTENSNSTPGARANNVPPSGETLNFEGNPLFEAGRYLAAHMQAANPDLLEQLRSFAARSTDRSNDDNPDSTTE